MIWAVVPTCRSFIIPEQSAPVTWIIVHDQEKRPVGERLESEVVHIVAPDPTLFGQRSDSIRSAGFLHAFLHGAPGDVILTVDDDCTIPWTWAEQHQQALSAMVPTWSETVPGLATRGMIRDERPVAISHGLWDGVPDVYATDQDERLWEMPRRVMPIHPPFAQSSMNLGFRLDVTPAMYQPAQGPDFGMDRFADIWGGLFAQRILMETDGFVNGAAVVYHTRASNREANRLKEAPGREIHEDLWRHVWKWKADPEGAVFVNTWTFSEHLGRFHHPYIQDTAMRLRRWLALISQRERP